MAVNNQPDPANLALASNTIMDIISKQQQMDKVQALLKLLEIYDIPITIAGEKQTVLYWNSRNTRTSIAN